MSVLGNFPVQALGKLTTLRTSFDGHVAATSGIHGAVSTATASRLMIRDGSGRVNVVSPPASDNSTLVATTSWVQGEISGAGGGTVTSVGSGTGLQGGPITSSGTLSLTNTGVTAATYTLATITVNAQGRITSASNGSAVASVLGTSPITVTGTTTRTVGINAATTGSAGSMSAADKSKLDNIAANAEVNAVDTVFGRTGAVVAQSGDYTISQIDGVTISTSAPSGGSNGDIWFQY